MRKLYRFLFARPRFKKLNTALFELSLSGLGVLNWEDENVSGEAHFIANVLPKWVRKKQPVFFDVGANVGAYSAKLRKAFPDAAIYSIEPHPKNFHRLVENLSPLGAVKPLQLAVGSTSGRINLYDRDDRDGSSHASIYSEVISELHKQSVTSHEVTMRTLDEIVRSEGVDRIDLLKIDTEGNELAVLQGAAELIAADRIRCIHFEFNEMNTVSRIFLRDFRKVLPDCAFYRLLPSGLLRLGESPLATELFAYQNIVAVRRDKPR